MHPTGGLRGLLQDAGSAVSGVFADGGGAAAASSDPVQHWSSSSHQLGPSGATIGIVCAVIVVLLVAATVTHWLHRSGRLPCCNKLLDDTADDEPTFLQARHSLEVPAPAAEPPPVVVLMPDDEVEIAVTEQQKQAGVAQRDAAGGLPGPAAPFAHPPVFWVVDADQHHSQGSDSPRSEGYQQGRRRQDSQAMPLLHRPAPRAGMQRRAKAAPSDSFVYMI